MTGYPDKVTFGDHEYTRNDLITEETLTLRTNLRHWRDECGKLHAQIQSMREGTVDGENINRLEAIEQAARRLAYIVRKSVNSGPLSKDPTSEAQAWRALRAALGETVDGEAP